MILRCAVFLFALVITVFCQGQNVAITPTISPSFFTQNDQITVTYNVTGTTLASLTNAYIWVWIPGANTNGNYNINPANSNAAVTNVVGPNGPKFTKSIVSGQTLFTITFTPSAFFSASISNASSMGMLLKGNDWADGQTTDHIASFGFQIQLTSPAQFPVFVDNNDNISINASTGIAANFELFINNVSVDTENSVTNYSYIHTVAEMSGSAEVRLVAIAGVNSDEIEFQYIISANSPAVSRPAGIIPGINYDVNDDTKVTLCLWAPQKTSVYVVGDFDEDWIPKAEYIMNHDGEYFWIELTGLTAGQEYAYQYLVDEHIWVADPYADKILDPEDQYIPEETYPNLKSFPSEAVRSEWYENRVAVFQTAQVPYVWQVTNFEKPAKESLVVYELLIRDFFDDQHRNYQSLIDTISYFKKLGINAIELMPVMEFNGNEGWGYNPTFMFAPDKYYGTRNKFKEFVDVCHLNGIAVVLDIAMNHHDVPNPFVSMYFDFDQFKPTANSPWFNVTAKHPFNVFFDMNHESAYTKTYLDTVNFYWLNEFKIDGFRFDLSKGFTQTLNTDVGLWSNYDQSRINILTRMADKIWESFPDAYVIMEHLGVNSEEKVLADYRANEGKGMMLWGKMTDQYNQNTMGYSSDSDISGVSHKSRSWNKPRLVGYMESHDEERLMYKNLKYGNAAGTYSTKVEKIALGRIRAAGLVFYTIPGPKMIWQFGELGYDYSINTCEDGITIDSDCRLSEKPLPWDERDDYFRNRLYEHTADLLRLRDEFDVFTTGDATISGGTSLTKQITIKNSPYTATPANASEMNVQIAVNFDVTVKSVELNFPHTGTWYSYYDYGTEISVTSTPFTIELQPGAYRLFTDVVITNPVVVTSIDDKQPISISLYPNPTKNTFTIDCNGEVLDLRLRTVQGLEVQATRLSSNVWDVSAVGSGLYIAEVVTRQGKQNVKLIKTSHE